MVVRSVLLGILLLLVGTLAVFAFASDDPAAESAPSREMAAVHGWFQDLINQYGTQPAYAIFKSEYAPAHFNTQHNAAHIVGELLYVAEGVDGIAICDADFAFGCYHGFFSRAISTEGMDIATELDEVCVRVFGPLGLGCPHGIGHGLVEYLGHDLSSLVDALAVCDTLTWKEPLFGCQDGVFMEYHFPVVFNDEGAPRMTTRELDGAQPYATCVSVPERFRESCHFSLPQWWNATLSAERVGELCGAIDDAQNQRACFLGMGNVTGPNTEYQPEEAIAACSLMPTHRGEVLCRAGASWSFYAYPEVRDRAPEVCEGLEEADRAFCLREAELVEEE